MKHSLTYKVVATLVSGLMIISFPLAAIYVGDTYPNVDKVMFFIGLGTSAFFTIWVATELSNMWRDK